LVWLLHEGNVPLGNIPAHCINQEKTMKLILSALCAAIIAAPLAFAGEKASVSDSANVGDPVAHCGKCEKCKDCKDGEKCEKCKKHKEEKKEEGTLA
jgi:hypothetical protein